MVIKRNNTEKMCVENLPITWHKRQFYISNDFSSNNDFIPTTYENFKRGQLKGSAHYSFAST